VPDLTGECDVLAQVAALEFRRIGRVPVGDEPVWPWLFLQV